MRHEERRLAEAATNAVEGLRVIAGEYRELAVLMNEYGEKKFGTDWWPQDDSDVVLGSDRSERLLRLLVKL